MIPISEKFAQAIIAAAHAELDAIEPDYTEALALEVKAEDAKDVPTAEKALRAAADKAHRLADGKVYVARREMCRQLLEEARQALIRCGLPTRKAKAEAAA